MQLANNKTLMRERNGPPTSINAALRMLADESRQPESLEAILEKIEETFTPEYFAATTNVQHLAAIRDAAHNLFNGFASLKIRIEREIGLLLRENV
jgi:hypothetical protein